MIWLYFYFVNMWYILTCKNKFPCLRGTRARKKTTKTLWKWEMRRIHVFLPLIKKALNAKITPPANPKEPYFCNIAIRSTVYTLDVSTFKGVLSYLWYCSHVPKDNWYQWTENAHKFAIFGYNESIENINAQWSLLRALPANPPVSYCTTSRKQRVPSRDGLILSGGLTYTDIKCFLYFHTNFVIFYSSSNRVTYSIIELYTYLIYKKLWW